jgi:hypothetical protein
VERIRRELKAAIASLFDPRDHPPLSDVSAYIRKAGEIVTEMRRLGAAQEISSVRYIDDGRTKGNPKIFLKDLSMIKLPHWPSENSRARLAAMLYCVGRILDVDVDIMHLSSVQEFNISTKHPHTHAGKLQKDLDKLLAESGLGGKSHPCNAEQVFNVEGVTLTAAEKQRLEEMAPEHQQRWRSLARSANRSRVINQKALDRHCEKEDETREDVYEFNEGVLSRQGMAFGIDYGSIDFREHMSLIKVVKQAFEEMKARSSALSVAAASPQTACEETTEAAQQPVDTAESKQPADSTSGA